MSRIDYAARSRQLLAEVDALVAPLAGVIAARRSAETAAARWSRLMSEAEKVPAGSPAWWTLYGQATQAKVEADRERATARLVRK